MSDELDLDMIDGQSGPVKPPKVVLVNESSNAAKTGGYTGMFNIEGTDKNFQRLEGVPIDAKQGKLWFLGHGTGYFCRSDDGVKPIESNSDKFKRQSSMCNGCPKAKWRGHKSPPECQDYVDITFANLDPNFPNEAFTMTFMRKSYKDAMLALGEMSNNGGVSKHKVVLNPLSMEGRNFTYYITVFESMDEIDQLTKDAIEPLKIKYRNKPRVLSNNSSTTSQNGPDFVELELEDLE